MDTAPRAVLSCRDWKRRIRSSIGQSIGLRNRGLQVRVLPDALMSFGPKRAQRQNSWQITYQIDTLFPCRRSRSSPGCSSPASRCSRGFPPRRRRATAVLKSNTRCMTAKSAAKRRPRRGMTMLNCRRAAAPRRLVSASRTRAEWRPMLTLFAPSRTTTGPIPASTSSIRETLRIPLNPDVATAVASAHAHVAPMARRRSPRRPGRRRCCRMHARRGCSANQRSSCPTPSFPA